MANNLKSILLIVSLVIAISLVGIVGVYFVITNQDPIPNFDTSKIIVVYPSFTEAAYGKNGFYSYYHGYCNKKCLTVHVIVNGSNQMSSSRNAYNIFKEKGYNLIDDFQLDNNPRLLKQYDKVIILHNEYVTQNEYNAITNHPNVIYLYPNSFYAKVQNNHNGTITLLRGHGYPPGILNGFDWKYDSSRFEFDRTCNNMSWIDIPNATQLNCYPEYSIYNQTIWNKIKN